MKTVCLLLDKREGEGARERIAAEFTGLHGPLEFFLVGDGVTSKNEYNHVDVVPPERRRGYTGWVNRPNSYNAFLSFRKIILRAQEEGHDSILLLEDDAQMICRETAERGLSEVAALPWRLCYLGANHEGTMTRRIPGTTLLAVSGSVCFHAVAVHSRAFSDLLSLPLENPIDNEAARRIHPNGHCYAVWPNAVIQKPGFSHCEGREVDYTHHFAHKGC